MNREIQLHIHQHHNLRKFATTYLFLVMSTFVIPFAIFTCLILLPVCCLRVYFIICTCRPRLSAVLVVAFLLLHTCLPPRICNYRVSFFFVPLLTTYHCFELFLFRLLSPACLMFRDFRFRVCFLFRLDR